MLLWICRPTFSSFWRVGRISDILLCCFPVFLLSDLPEHLFPTYCSDIAFRISLLCRIKLHFRHTSPWLLSEFSYFSTCWTHCSTVAFRLFLLSDMLNTFPTEFAVRHSQISDSPNTLPTDFHKTYSSSRKIVCSGVFSRLRKNILLFTHKNGYSEIGMFTVYSNYNMVMIYIFRCHFCT